MPSNDQDRPFIRSINAQIISAAIIKVAKDEKILNGPMLTSQPLAELEKFLFIELFKLLQKHLAEVNRTELTHDEINSMFVFVFARSAEMTEHAMSKTERAVYELDSEGCFTGDTPFNASPQTSRKIQENVCFPTRCAEAFLELNPHLQRERDDESLLLLFEALKWCFRFGVHLALSLRKDVKIDE